MQALFNLSQQLALHQIKDVVLSPGSRCAPLTVAFARNAAFSMDVVSDERSAAFIALGKSIQSRIPSVLICTSGSAVYNYAPAVVEAYYQKIPLIVLSADRPKEWIGQNDGQTMEQTELFGKHVLKSYELSVDHNHPESIWLTQRIVDEAVELAYSGGPVHINIPIREPFYEALNQSYDTSAVYARKFTLNNFQLSVEALNELNTELSKHKKVVLIAGQQQHSDELRAIASTLQVPIINECVSNLHGLSNVVTTHDAILSALSDNDKKEIAPTLVIRFGDALLSKPLKQWLRSINAEHWVLQSSGNVADVFKSTHRVIRADVASTLSALKFNADTYLNAWQSLQKTYRTKIDQLTSDKTNWSELHVLAQCIQTAPKDTVMHLSNSMSVRYANYLNLEFFNEVNANRGVSGIDGVTSTALGYSSNSNQMNVLITGDQAFFYDRNAFWNSINKKNLKIILLNNQAGSIFRMIDGPAALPELEKYFEAPHSLTAESLAKEFNLNYYACDSYESLTKNLQAFYSDTNSCSILEIKSDSSKNVQQFKYFKSQL